MAETHPILLFDGECNLCNGTVQFIIERDPDAHFRFASLQSQAGERLLDERKVENDLDTVVLVDGDRVYERSAAALKTFHHLGGLWRLLGVFWVIPRPIRDWLYAQIARRRYSLFGRRDSCMIPTGDRKQRFLTYDDP